MMIVVFIKMPRPSYIILSVSIVSSLLCIFLIALNDRETNKSYKNPRVWRTPQVLPHPENPTEVIKTTDYAEYEQRFQLDLTENDIEETINILKRISTKTYEHIKFTSGSSISNQGDSCATESRKGTCRKLSDCPAAQMSIRAGEYPKICSFDGLLPVVCCIRTQSPTFEETTTQRWTTQKPQMTQRPWKKSKAQQKCQEYSEYVYKFSINPILLPNEPEYTKDTQCYMDTQPLIVGGVNATANEFPHMAHIGYGEEPRITYQCGGTLISERFVLSAAHCTKIPVGLAKWARLGDLNVLSSNDGVRPIVIRIVQRFNHPEYNNVRLYNDLALFKLERNVRLSPEIRPLCLYTDLNIPNIHAVATGWGHTHYGGSSSPVLQKVSLKLVDTATCNDSFARNIGKQLPNGIVEDQMVCAGGETGKDACQGDSGGPLQIGLSEPFCMYSIVGITSFGKACGQESPGVYTRVSYYVPWIESIVWP